MSKQQIIQILRGLYIDMMQSQDYRVLWYYLQDLENIIIALEKEILNDD